MHERSHVLVPLGGKLFEFRIAVRGSVGQIAHALIVTLFEHLVEDRASPAFRGVALLGRTVLETVGLIGLDVVPAEAAALEDRVQRVDHDEPVGERQSLGAAALAETADQLAFRRAGEALGDQPVDQAEARSELHGTDYAAWRAVTKALPCNALSALTTLLRERQMRLRMENRMQPAGIGLTTR